MLVLFQRRNYLFDNMETWQEAGQAQAAGIPDRKSGLLITQLNWVSFRVKKRLDNVSILHGLLCHLQGHNLPPTWYVDMGGGLGGEQSKSMEKKLILLLTAEIIWREIAE